jgi:hypothetical protein
MDEHLFSVLLIVFGVLFEYEILNILVVQTMESITKTMRIPYLS